MWEDWLQIHQIRGWRAVSAAGLQGKGSCKRKSLILNEHLFYEGNVFFTDAATRDAPMAWDLKRHRAPLH